MTSNNGDSVRLSEIISPNFFELHKELKCNNYDEAWLRGGRGSTKSTFATLEIIVGMIADPEANAVAMRRYDNELRDTVYGQFLWTINRLGLSDRFRPQYAPMQIIYEETGQKIIFKGADKPLKLKSINIGKGYIKYALFEEVDQFSGMPEIRNVLQSLFRGENKPRTAFFCYNPPKSGRSWVNQEVKIQKPGRIVHSSDYRSVPPDWLGDVFLAGAAHLEKVNPTAYRHEYLGEEVGTGLEIFTNVVIREITDEEISHFDRLRQGMDFGYAVDPYVFNRMHYDKTRLRLYIFAEDSGVGVSNREIWRRTCHYNDVHTTGDSAEPKTLAELRSLGMDISGAKKGPDSVGFGIRALQALEAIIIDPVRCPRAAKEFQNYSFEILRSGEVRSDYPDRDNHAIDDVRYALEDDFAAAKVKVRAHGTTRPERRKVHI